jgi:serine/threonine protein kinase
MGPRSPKRRKLFVILETMTQDHRTDLYSLGILFWTLLVGRGQMPFEGGALELLHSIVQKRPMPVHEVRRDVHRY